MNYPRIETLAITALLWSGWFASTSHAHDAPPAVVHAHADHETVVIATTPTPQVTVVQQNAPVAERPAREDSPWPSTLLYGLQGFWGGSLVGLSTGYLVLRDNHLHEPWRSYVLATGIGALSGAGLGLALGVFDTTTSDRPARFVMRDGVYGTLLGGLLGASVGGLVALGSGRGEDAILGAAIGGVVGLISGSALGVLQGRHPRFRDGLRPGLSVTRDASGRRAFGPSLSGRF